MCQVYVRADPILYESRSRSLRIRGVVTTLRLENQFWDILREIAATIPAYAEARVERRPLSAVTDSRGISAKVVSPNSDAASVTLVTPRMSAPWVRKVAMSRYSVRRLMPSAGASSGPVCG